MPERGEGEEKKKKERMFVSVNGMLFFDSGNLNFDWGISLPRWNKIDRGRKISERTFIYRRLCNFNSRL